MKIQYKTIVNNHNYKYDYDDFKGPARLEPAAGRVAVQPAVAGKLGPPSCWPPLAQSPDGGLGAGFGGGEQLSSMFEV